MYLNVELIKDKQEVPSNFHSCYQSAALCFSSFQGAGNVLSDVNFELHHTRSESLGYGESSNVCLLEKVISKEHELAVLDQVAAICGNQFEFYVPSQQHPSPMEPITHVQAVVDKDIMEPTNDEEDKSAKGYG